MDLDDFFLQESTNYEKAKDLGRLLQYKNESFIKLKKKIIATSSVLTLYKEATNECENLKQVNLELITRVDQLTKECKELLLNKTASEKSLILLQNEYDEILNKYNQAIEQSNGKTSTIKQLEDYTENLKNKLGGNQVELAMLKSKCKDEVDKLKSSIKSLKSAQQLESKVIAKVLSHVKALKKELRGEYLKSPSLIALIKELNQLKGCKNKTPLNSDAEVLPEFNEDEMPFNSPASVDTGKGSTVCTSDDEKSLSVPTSPTRCESISSFDLLSPRSCFNQEQDYNNRFISVSTSPMQQDCCRTFCEKFALSSKKVCTSNIATSPIKIESLEKKIRGSLSADDDDSKVVETNNCEKQTYDENYVNDILTKMTGRIKIITPLPWNEWNSENGVEKPSSFSGYIHDSPVKQKSKCLQIRKRKQLTRKRMVEIIKQLVKSEVRGLFRLKTKTQKKNLISKINSKKNSSANKCPTVSKDNLVKRIGREVKVHQMNYRKRKQNHTNIATIKKNTVLKNSLPDVDRFKYKKSSNLLEPTRDDTNVPLSIKLASESETSLQLAVSNDALKSPNIIKTQKEIENDKKIDEAKKILSKLKTKDDNSTKKTYIKWRVRSEFKDTSLILSPITKQRTQTTDITENIGKRPTIKKLSSKIKNENKIRQILRKDLKENKNTKCDNSCSPTGIVNNEGTCEGISDVPTSIIVDMDVTSNTSVEIVHPQRDIDELLTIVPNKGYRDLDKDCSENLFPAKSYAFRSLLASTIIEWKKKKKVVQHYEADEQLCKKFETFLSNDFTLEHLESFVGSVSIHKEETIAYAIVEFLNSSNRYCDETFHHYPMLPMTRSHQAALVLMNKMAESPTSKVNIIDLVMRGIEFKMFKLNSTPPLQSLRNMTLIYVALCRVKKQKDRLKLFCLDSLYCMSYSASPILYLVLRCWPALFPKSQYSCAKDPLFITLCHIALSTVSEIEAYDSVALQKLLNSHYGFTIGEYADSQVLSNLLDCVKENKGAQTKGLISAFLLLGKRTGVDWCYNNIIIKALLPIIDDANGSSYSRTMAVRLIGPLIRPFPNTKTLQLGILFQKLLHLFGKTNDPCIDEAILSSAIHFRKNTSDLINKLIEWQPSYQMTPSMQEILLNVVYGKSKSFWITKLNKFEAFRK